MPRIFQSFYFPDFHNISFELQSSSRQDVKEMRRCRTDDCTKDGVLEKCPITCRWYDQDPSIGLTCYRNPSYRETFHKDVDYTIFCNYL